MQNVVSSQRHRPGGFPSSMTETNGDGNGNTTGLEAGTFSRNADATKTYSVDEALETIGIGCLQVKIYLVGEFIFAAESVELMILAVLSPLVRCEWNLDDLQIAFITTAVFIGMGLSAPLCGIVGDIYGRKVTLFLTSIGISYFGFLVSFTPSYWWLVLLRFLVGVGMGGSPQGYSLNAEYIPSKYRAKLLVLGTIFVTMGTAFEIILAMIVVPTLGWRWLVAISAIPSLITALCLFCIPESVRFLVAAGQLKHASRILEEAAKGNKQTLPDGILIPSKEVMRGRVRDLFSHEYLRSSLQLWLIWFGAAFSLFGIILANAEILMIRNNEHKSHCKCTSLTTDDYIAMLLSTCGEILSLPINWLLMDRFGRRVTGGVCFWGAAIFMILLQIDVPITVLTLFMFCTRTFVMASFIFAYVYTSELYPTSIRTLGLGFCSGFGRIGAMITPFVAQVLLASSIATATWVFGILCFLCGICAFLLPIETLGRPLPQAVGNNPNFG